MSDYVRNKQVMYPIDDNLLKKLNCEEAWNLETKYEVLKIDYSKSENYFEMQGTEKSDYLAYTLKSYYGGYAGKFGHSRILTETEQAKYKKLFEEAFPGIEFDATKFRYVDYCYYNGCDAPDFYDAEDEFNKEI